MSPDKPGGALSASRGGVQSPRACKVSPTSPSPGSSSPHGSMLIPLTDCAKGVGIGLNKSNVITQLNPGGAAARSGLLRLGDQVVGVDGETLEAITLTLTLALTQP